MGATYIKLPYLAAWRRYRSLSQRDLAQRVGRSLHTVKSWERERYGAVPASLAAVARALGISTHALITTCPPQAYSDEADTTTEQPLQALEDYLYARFKERLRAEHLL